MVDPELLEYSAEMSFLPFVEEVAEDLRKYGRELLERVAGQVKEALGTNVEVESELLEGSPGDVILDHCKAWAADMLFLGSHGRKGINRFIRGSVSTTVASSTPCSVVVLHDSAQTLAEDKKAPVKILVPVGDDRFAMKVAEFLAAHTWQEGTEFLVVHAVEPLLIGSPLAVLPSAIVSEIKKSKEARGKSLVTAVEQTIKQSCPSAAIKARVIDGFPKDTIIDIIKQWRPDFVAVGSHARKGVHKLLLGSVSTAVLNNTPCSIAIIH